MGLASVRCSDEPTVLLSVPNHSETDRSSLSTRFLRSAEKCRTIIEADAVRLSLQTVVAVVLVYVWMRWQALPEIAWGAFSALFVVRASVEGTIGEASARILGALIGVVLGVSLVLVANAAGVGPTWRITAGVGAAAYLSMRWPMLSYSLVTVTILTVMPDNDILGGAIHKGVAILIGSASGILAAAAVLPLSARRSVRMNLAASIEAYGEMLVDWVSTFNDAREHPPLHEPPVMKRTRGQARDMAAQACSFPLDMVYSHASVDRLQNRIESLWRTAPLMERTGNFVLSHRLCACLSPALEEVAQALKQQLGDLADALRKRDVAPSRHRLDASLKGLDDAIEEAVRTRGCDASERDAIGVIRWVWHEVAREVHALDDYLNEGRTGSGPAR